MQPQSRNNNRDSRGDLRQVTPDSNQRRSEDRRTSQRQLVNNPRREASLRVRWENDLYERQSI